LFKVSQVKDLISTSPPLTSNGRDATEKVAFPLLFSFSNFNQAQSLFPDWKEDQSTQVFIPRPFTLPAFHDKTVVLLLKENAITSYIAWTHSKGGNINAVNFNSQIVKMS